ncbi:hypothetical protein AB0I28_26030 [Phytomonospora sp. NPDC050363]|uniref:LppU/SCO3897 family protein n=1 Tax=Phytomonospora sp. NPDC050363 TaxID=3155642 RepID=UPI003408CEEE
MAQQPPPGNYPPPSGGQYPPPGGQPGQPGQPQGGFPPPAPGAPQGGFPPPAPPAKKGAGGKIAAVVGVVVVIGIVLVLKFGISALFGDSALDAKTGDCLTNTADANDTEVVDCSDASAYYTVTSVDNAPGSDQTQWCMGDEQATTTLSEGESLTNPDVVYCLVEK